MMRTLLILCVLAAAIATLALVRLNATAEFATEAQAQLSECRQFLGNSSRRAAALQLGLLGAPSTGAASADSAAGGPGGNLEFGIRQASTATGVSEQLRNVAWSNPTAIQGSDLREIKAFLRLESVTMEGLTRFLHYLADADPTSRTHMIELSTPVDTAAIGDTVPERWSADITLAYRVGPAGGRRN